MRAEELPAPPRDFIDATLDYLGTDACIEAIEADPYWPKWDGPWWRMALLRELGLGSRVPHATARALAVACDEHYLHSFPIAEGDLPDGVDAEDFDPTRHVLCHCAAGTLVQVLGRAGLGDDEVLPWLRPYMLDRRLTDGGVNCDERVYAKDDGKSSMLSTVVAMEAFLDTERELTEGERAFVDAAADYLIAHRLVRRAGGGEIIDASWLLPCFPRFYDYDALRGLTALTRWATADPARTIPREAVEEVWTQLRSAREEQGAVMIGRLAAPTEQWTMRRDEDGAWRRDERADSFPLLDAVSAVGTASRQLTAELDETHARLERLASAGRLT